ncbi:odorant receptor 4-like [Pseudomyrmex gracilis]|uniref:odorant receptor 4-like n=1 Tax=Pseudomyrmex gracilis TaxID=219809 RepID=UPI00099512CC|nr:odorant receptor 4-like [Pseudomyrmex gracilis]
MARKSTLNRTLRFVLTLCGIWPDASYVLLYRTFWIVTTTMILFCHYRYFLTHVYSAKLVDLMDCVSSFLAFSKVIIKCALFWLNQRKFAEILAMITKDWNDCASCEISMRKITSKAKISDRIANTIITLHTVTIFLYCFGIILADVDVNDHTTELPFVNKIELPFSIKTQRLYRCVLMAQFFHMILSAWAAGIINALLLTLTLHIAGQIDILCHWLSQSMPCEDKTAHESVVIATSKIIQKHQKIIDFSENVENMFTHIALVQFVTNTIMICLLGFLIVTAIGSPNMMEEILKSSFFYTITNLEAFIFCFAGEYLNNKSKEVGIAAYNCGWYNLQPKDSRVLLFIILRSQKQLRLTVGKMMDLSLNSFTSIMNASGSYMSVLLAMQ